MNLNSVKSGDKLILVKFSNAKVVTVFRVTKTMIVIGNDTNYQRFRKSDGWMVGGDQSYSTYLKFIDKESLEDIERRNDLIEVQDMIKLLTSMSNRKNINNVRMAKQSILNAVNILKGNS